MEFSYFEELPANCWIKKYSRFKQISCIVSSPCLTLAAPINLDCPKLIEIEAGTSKGLVVNATGTLPIRLSSYPTIGKLTNVSASQEPHFSTLVHWHISSNDARLTVGYKKTVSWTASYTGGKCTDLEFDKTVQANCHVASRPVQCNSTILIYSKFFESLNVTLLIDLSVSLTHSVSASWHTLSRSSARHTHNHRTIGVH